VIKEDHLPVVADRLPDEEVVDLPVAVVGLVVADLLPECLAG
jgi:hypothetical protein